MLTISINKGNANKTTLRFHLTAIRIASIKITNSKCWQGCREKGTLTHCWWGTCTPMFTAALFTIAKLWKQPRCPTPDEWIKKMWYLYTMEFYAAMKKNEMLSFAGK
jgi:hypothetical protein